MRTVLVLFLFVALASLRADPPAGYYNAANGLTGLQLKAALNTIIKNGHTVIPYDDLDNNGGALQTIWQNPANPSQILLCYGSAPVAKTSTVWNNEHVWPRSRGNDDHAGPDDSDLHHVFPAYSNANSARNNRYYDVSNPSDSGYASPGDPTAPGTSKDSDSWEPTASEKGDIARALFYIAVRYDGTEPNTEDMELVTTNPTGPQMGNLSTLLAWHNADPPDAAEKARNDAIYTTWQHNRNPFIDHPEWVAEIWGNSGTGVSAQASAPTSLSYESPATNGSFSIALGSGAPSGGITVNFTVSGTAGLTGDYTLSGAGLTYNTSTGVGTMSFVSGVSTRTITVTPVVDAVAESPETIVLTLTSGTGYTIIGSAATITISDTPPTSATGVIASWNFNAVPYPTTIPPTTGNGSLSLAGWGGTVSNFGGVGTGDALSLVAGGTGSPYPGNGTYLEIAISTVGWTQLRLGFQTRGTSTGFTTGSWSWSVNGTTYNTLSGVNTATTSTTFAAKTVDFSNIPALVNASNVRLRYTLNGATSSSGNNRIDDLVITGVQYSGDWLTRYPGAGIYTDDPDGDGLSNFAEWVQDSTPFGPQTERAVAARNITAPDPADGNIVKTWPAITFVRRTDAPSVTYTVQQNTNLLNAAGWVGGCVLVSTATGPTSGTEYATYRATTPVGIGSVFLRVVASQP